MIFFILRPNSCQPLAFSYQQITDSLKKIKYDKSLGDIFDIRENRCLHHW